MMPLVIAALAGGLESTERSGDKFAGRNLKTHPLSDAEKAELEAAYEKRQADADRRAAELDADRKRREADIRARIQELTRQDRIVADGIRADRLARKRAVAEKIAARQAAKIKPA